MILIGTIHQDIEGTKRLENLLNKIKPKIITIEWPTGKSLEEIEKEILDYRSKNIQILEGSEMPRSIKKFFIEFVSNSNYETLVPIQYTKKTGAKVYLVDHPKILSAGDSKKVYLAEVLLKDSHYKEYKKTYNEIKKHYTESISKLYLEHKHVKDLGKKVAKDMTNKEKMKFVESKQTKMLLDVNFEEEREEFVSKEILRINPDVHISGMSHVFKKRSLDIKPLFKRLGNKVSERIKLCDAFSYEPNN